MKLRHVIPMIVGIAGGLLATRWLLSWLFSGSGGETDSPAVIWVGLTIFSVAAGFLCCCGLLVSGFIARLCRPKS